MKIDIFTHVMPRKYKQALYKYADKFATEKAVQNVQMEVFYETGKI